MLPLAGTHTIWIGHDFNPAKIEPVCIPASLNGHVIMVSLMRVAFAGSYKKGEGCVAQINVGVTQGESKLCCTFSVVRIRVFVKAP